MFLKHFNRGLETSVGWLSYSILFTTAFDQKKHSDNHKDYAWNTSHKTTTKS